MENIVLQVTAWWLQVCRTRLPGIFIKPDDSISRVLLLGVDHDEEVLAVLRFLGARLPGMFLDIGANIGLMSTAMVGINRRIECIEPNPLMTNILRTNMALSGARSFTIHEYALGFEAGTAKLRIPRTNMGGAFIPDSKNRVEGVPTKFAARDVSGENQYWTQTVPVLAFKNGLQMLEGEQPDGVVVKIDAEGYDLQIVSAILDEYDHLFERNLISIVFESWDYKPVPALAKRVAAKGYGVFTLQVQSTPDLRLTVLTKIARLFRGTHRTLVLKPVGNGELECKCYLVCPLSFVQQS